MKIELGQFGNKLRNTYLIGGKPIQDWQRIVTICFAVLLGVFIWSYFFYFSVQSEFKNSLTNPSQFVPVKDKEEEIKEAVDKYKEKEALWFELGDGVVETSISTTTNVSGIDNVANIGRTTGATNATNATSSTNTVGATKVIK